MSKIEIIKPDYYKSGSFNYDVIDVAQSFSLKFNLGNVLKYIARAGYKDPKKRIEDLEKAQEYLRREIEFLKGIEND